MLHTEEAIPPLVAILFHPEIEDLGRRLVSRKRSGHRSIGDVKSDVREDLLRGFGRLLYGDIPERIGGYPLVGYITFPRIEDEQIGLGAFDRCC